MVVNPNRNKLKRKPGYLISRGRKIENYENLTETIIIKVTKEFKEKVIKESERRVIPYSTFVRECIEIVLNDKNKTYKIIVPDETPIIKQWGTLTFKG